MLVCFLDVNMIQSIERGIEILRLLETGPLGVTELANATALPKTTVHRLLKTFEAHHWVEFNRDKKYQLSWGVLPMAKSFLSLWMCVPLRSHTWWLFAISCSSP